MKKICICEYRNVRKVRNAAGAFSPRTSLRGLPRTASHLDRTDGATSEGSKASGVTDVLREIKWLSFMWPKKMNETLVRWH